MYFSALLLSAAPYVAPQVPEIPADTEILTTPSGLKYSILAPGNGEDPPRRGDRVLVQYTGWLEDGTMFDSSRTRGQAATFGIGQVIEGWNEALQMMSPGARYKLTIPYELAYGEAGRPPRIPAKANLIFDVELLEVSARVPDFLPVDETESENTESGLKLQWLQRGQGPERRPGSTIWLEYEFWDAEGTCHFATSMQPKPVLLSPRNVPYKFFPEVLERMREGDEVLVEVPPELGFGDSAMGKLPANSVTIWRLRMVRVFGKPDFEMPSEDQLTTLPSGLQYRMIKEGKGRSPKATDRVQVHYTGWLTDGEGFDSSYNRNAPASFPLNGVIAGWTEGLQHVREGGVIQLVIPGHLGYGKKGSPPKIGPDATLVFTVELISIL